MSGSTPNLSTLLGDRPATVRALPGRASWATAACGRSNRRIATAGLPTATGGAGRPGRAAACRRANGAVPSGGHTSRSRFGDSGFGMNVQGLLNDETIEAIVAGDVVDSRFDAVVAFVRGVRRLGEGPVPRPDAGLEAVFAGGPPRHVARVRRAPVRRVRRVPVAVARVAGLGVVAKVALGTSLAAAGVAAAGAGGALPAPATDGVRRAIEVVTPVEFEADRRGDVSRPDGAARFGERVSDDATGVSDGAPGVDGGEVSGEAPGASRRPGNAGPGTPSGGGAGGAPTPSSTVPAMPPSAGGAGAPEAPGAPGALGGAASGGAGEVPSPPTSVVPSSVVPVPGTVPTPGAVAPDAGAAPLGRGSR